MAVNLEMSRDYNQNLQEKNWPSEKLPIEVLENIFCYLNDKSMSEVSLVSKDWNAAIIEKAKKEKFSKIENFIFFLGENLTVDPYICQIGELFSTCDNTEFVKSLNLKKLKLPINACKLSFLNILKNLSETYLKDLEELAKIKLKPHFFESIFDLTRGYKKVNLAKGNVTKYNMIMDIIKSCGSEGAFIIAKVMPSDDHRSYFLSCISSSFIQKDRISKATKTIGMITESYSQQAALMALEFGLTSKGCSDKTIRKVKALMETLPNSSEKRALDRRLQKISAENAQRRLNIFFSGNLNNGSL